jgi:hypothetical protein
VAVERPAVDAARLAAPVAGLRSARTGVVGLRPAGAPVGLAEPRSGWDGDLPGPAGLPAGHQVSPPLACCRAPTTSASKRAQPSRSRMATVLPVGGTCRRRSGCGWRPEGAAAGRVLGHGSLLGHQVGVGPRPSVYALTRQVWPVDQAISPSPRSGRDVAGGQTAGRQLRSRAGHATSSPPPWWCRARTGPQFAMARRGWPYAKPGPGRPIRE